MLDRVGKLIKLTDEGKKGSDNGVTGYYRRNLRIDRFNLSRVGVIYDPVEDEIIHCMRFEKGKRYCDQRQHQDFVKIRWW